MLDSLAHPVPASSTVPRTAQSFREAAQTRRLVGIMASDYPLPAAGSAMGRPVNRTNAEHPGGIDGTGEGSFAE
jgi:hypothetical protein